MKHEPEARDHGDPAATERAWELLGHATCTTASSGFAARVVAATRGEPIERPAAGFRWLRLAAPMAAAAALVIAFALSFLQPAGQPGGIVATNASADLVALARMEAAIDLLPEDADVADIDPAMLDLANIDDPSKIPEDQLLGLLY